MAWCLLDPNSVAAYVRHQRPGSQQACAPETYAMLYRGPLSTGDAYLQSQTAAYNIKQAQGRMLYGSDYAVANYQMGSELMHHNPFQAAQTLHKVSLALIIHSPHALCTLWMRCLTADILWQSSCLPWTCQLSDLCGGSSSIWQER